MKRGERKELGSVQFGPKLGGIYRICPPKLGRWESVHRPWSVHTWLVHRWETLFPNWKLVVYIYCGVSEQEGHHSFPSFLLFLISSGLLPLWLSLFWDIPLFYVYAMALSFYFGLCPFIFCCCYAVPLFWWVLLFWLFCFTVILIFMFIFYGDYFSDLWSFWSLIWLFSLIYFTDLFTDLLIYLWSFTILLISLLFFELFIDLWFLYWFFDLIIYFFTDLWSVYWSLICLLIFDLFTDLWPFYWFLIYLLIFDLFHWSLISLLISFIFYNFYLFVFVSLLLYLG